MFAKFLHQSGDLCWVCRLWGSPHPPRSSANGIRWHILQPKRKLQHLLLLFSPALSCVTEQKPCAVGGLFTSKWGRLRGWRCNVLFRLHRALTGHTGPNSNNATLIGAQLKQYTTLSPAQTILLYQSPAQTEYYSEPSSNNTTLIGAQLRQNTTLRAQLKQYYSQSPAQTILLYQSPAQTEYSSFSAQLKQNTNLLSWGVEKRCFVEAGLKSIFMKILS